MEYARVAQVAGYLAAMDALMLPAANDNAAGVQPPLTIARQTIWPAARVDQMEARHDPRTIWFLRVIELLIAAIIILFFL